jgi:diguanylate cyclase (GGDEF)-like protein
LMVDVDHFKRVNDTHGHVIGDRVLHEIANRISGMTRNYDSAGRYGGEEFVVILPGCSIVDGMQRAEQFRSVIAETPICTDAGSLYITCSFGVASPACVTNIEALIHQADQALYLAKSAGRNCIYAN